MLTGSADNSKSLQKRIVTGSVILLSGSTLVTGINLAYNIAVARFLGPRGFGHATVVYTLLTLVSAVTLSFQIVCAKVVAQQDSLESKRAAYRDFHLASWGFGAVISSLLMVFRHGVADYLNLPSPVLITLLAVGAAFYVPLGSRRGYIQGAYGFRRLATNLVLEAAIRLLGSIAMVLLGFGVTGVIAANAAAMAVAWLAIAPEQTASVPNPLRFRYAMREIAQALIFFSGQVLINNCDIVLVEHYFAATDAGLYAAIAMVGRVIFAFSQAVVNSMFPVVAGTRVEDRKGPRLIMTSLALVLAIGSVIAITLRFIPASVWTTFFGAGFKLPGNHGFPYLLALYAISTVIYSLSVVVITYEMAYKIANTSWLQLIFGGFVILGIARFHATLQQVIMVQLVLMSALLLIVGIPFLLDAMRSAQGFDIAGSRSIRLLRRVSEDEVISEFLKADFSSKVYDGYHEKLRPVVFAPDLTNPAESLKRRALFFLRHRALWKELPQTTEWFEVEVADTNLSQIRVFPRAQWRRVARGQFGVPQVAERIRNRYPLTEQSFHGKIDSIRDAFVDERSNLGSVILIGLNDTQPLTVIDGNHRLIAAVLEGRMHKLRFLCGLSSEMTRCCWYRTNPLTLMKYAMNLLFNSHRRPDADLKRIFGNSG